MLVLNFWQKTYKIKKHPTDPVGTLIFCLWFLYFVIGELFRTDKWAETELGTKWGDKWEEKFFSGIGSRQGETWHVSPNSDRQFLLLVT